MRQFNVFALGICLATNVWAAGIGSVTGSQATAPVQNLPGLKPTAAEPQARSLGKYPFAPSQAKALDPATGAVYTYDAVGNRIGVDYANGIQTRYRYDSLNRVVELTTSRDGLAIHHQLFTLDPSGLRTALLEDDVTGPLRAIEWEYDGLKRLTKETILHADPALSRTSTWTYDKAGNRLSQSLVRSQSSITTTYVYDANDRLLSETTVGGQNPGTTNYSYDASGNPLTKSAPGQFIEYFYNGAGKLREMRSAGQTVRYTYDADGLLATKTVLPVTGAMVAQRFLWDRGRRVPQVIEEQTSTAGGAFQVTAQYTFADDLVAETRNGAVSYVLTDALGSTRALADNTGTVTDKVSYDAFGNVIERSGTSEIGHLYRGEQLDPNLGFYNLRARWMDPSSGRFTQMDTFPGAGISPVSLHRYLYAFGQPPNVRDPSGHFGIVEFSTALDVLGAMISAAPGGLSGKEKELLDRSDWRFQFLDARFRHNRAMELNMSIADHHVTMNVPIGPFNPEDQADVIAADIAIGSIMTYWGNVTDISTPQKIPYFLTTHVTDAGWWDRTSGTAVLVNNVADCDVGGLHTPGGMGIGICPGWRRTTGAHEFGHVLGFKDLSNATDSKYCSPGEWPDDIMDCSDQPRSVKWQHIKVIDENYPHR